MASLYFRLMSVNMCPISLKQSFLRIEFYRNVLAFLSVFFFSFCLYRFLRFCYPAFQFHNQNTHKHILIAYILATLIEIYKKRRKYFSFEMRLL